MAAPERTRGRPLSWLLEERPQRFELFEAVRLIEQLLPEREPVGSGSDPRREVIRFHGHVCLHFPRGDLEAVRLPEPGASGPARVDVNVLSLAHAGVFGSLPPPYVARLLEELRDGRTALRDFLDLFTHRFVSLFYRAWSKSRPRHAAGPDRASDLERAVFGLIGLGAASLRSRLPLPDASLLARAGLLLRRPASALALEALLASYFAVRVRVLPFQPLEVELEPDERTRIGRAHARLGRDTVVGSRVTLRDTRIRIVIGPLSRAEHESFLPHGAAHLALCRLVRLALTPELDFDLKLVLRARDVPRLRIARDPLPPRLGRSAWLLAAPAERDRHEPVLTPPPDLLPSQADRPSIA